MKQRKTERETPPNNNTKTLRLKENLWKLYRVWFRKLAVGLYVSMTMGNCLGRRSKVVKSLSSRANSGNVSGPCSCRFYYMQVDDHFMFSVLFLLLL